jgi:hypothetical protein
MPKHLRLNFIILSIIGLILVLSFNISPKSKVEAQTNSTKLIGYAWSENIGWISFSSENVPAVETAPAPVAPAAPAAVVCTPLPPLTQTSTPCPSGQVGLITESKASTCPGPIYAADWTVTSNTCAVPPATIIENNGATPALNCAQKCQVIGKTCISVGDDPGATNGYYLYDESGAQNCSALRELGLVGTYFGPKRYGCNMEMSDTDSYVGKRAICRGRQTMWTNCKCQ